ncbi:MAG: hypothetical protein EP330_10960 [Deltaproteobacteria bacterium]|nr:MAG: hypothetical protein EP330_10960 [Deltaproteobacteria bacterium]
MRILPLLLLACTGSEPAPPAIPDVPRLPIDQTGAGPLIRLEPEDAVLALPEGESADVQTAFTLTDFAPDGGFEGCLYAAAPFAMSRAQERALPDGIEVLVDGEPVPYQPWSHTPEKGWRIAHGALHLTGFAKIDKVELSYPKLARRADRYQPSQAGLTPEAFVRMRYQAGVVTRRGLLLPAPATAAWPLTAAKGQRFEAAVALAVPPGLESASDGVTAVLRFVEGDKVTELDRREVEPSSWLGKRLVELDVTRDDPFVDWVVPLDKIAGRSGTLEIVSEVRGSAAQDYLFVAHPEVASTPTAPPRHVIVIGLDTTRPDHMGAYGYPRPTTPELDAFAETATVFDAAWTPAPRTRPSFRSATTGRYPLTAVGATNIGEVFQDHGFATAGIVANVHLAPRFDFDHGFDMWRLDPKAIGEEQVDQALAWLEAHRHRDAYLFLHMMDPHLFYKPPGEFADKFVDHPDPELPPEFNRWTVSRMERSGELTDQRKAHIIGLYDGEMGYLSSQLGRFFEKLDALGPQTLVVVHSDHGEELWEHGGFEHNHALYDDVTRAVLMVRPPHGETPTPRADVPATLADIAPTLYDYVGFEDTPETDGVSLKPFVEGAEAGELAHRPIGTAHLMYEREQWGVVVDGHKYIVRTADGEEELYDLAEDPEEKKNLAGTVDMAPYRAALSAAHLDMPVGEGWRLAFILTEPMTVKLPAPAIRAGLFDPEAMRRGRANLAWGEKPEATPEDVAKVWLSEDGRRLHIEPARKGRGTAWVMFDEAQPTRKVEMLRNSRVQRVFHHDDRSTWETPGREHVIVRAGPVFDTPIGEAARIASLKEREASGSDLEMLNALGYIHDEGDEEEESPKAPPTPVTPKK